MWCGLVRSGEAGCGLAVEVRSGAVGFDAVWCGLVRFGTVGFGSWGTVR